jgi:hypothetical protein
VAERESTQASDRRTPASRKLTRRLRLVVLVVALAAAAVKLYLAAKSAGSNDVATYAVFANAIRKVGPVSIYGLKAFDGLHGHRLYNHPPLIGWMLLLLSHISDWGVSFRFLIRVPATVADVITALLVFELVRIRRPIVEAAVAGVLVGGSPALLVVSGFHGNTDPVFVMFAIMSLWLLVTDRSAILAGLSIAAAISIKIIPIVSIPVLFLIAWRAGRRRTIEFSAAFGAAMAVLWVPVALTHWHEYATNVLGYKGLHGKWGIVEFASNNLHLSPHALTLIEGPGRWPMLLLSAGLPVFVAWRRPAASIPAFGLSLVLVLMLSTASSGGRYHVWSLGAAFLINVPVAAVFDISTSILLIHVYNRWSGGRWYDTPFASAWTHGETALAAFTWFALLALTILAVVPVFRPAPAEAPDSLDLGHDVDTDATKVPLAISDLN